MYPRTNYEMTAEQLNKIVDACRPVMCIKIGNSMPSTPQANANMAWQSLGKEMGFDHMTVRPVAGKTSRFFSAVPSETEQQRSDRVVAETKAADEREIAKLKSEIKSRQDRLDYLQDD